MTRQFHIGVVLSISHDALMAPNLIDDVYDILNFMTGGNLYTHQLPRVCLECRPFLFQQHPQLKEWGGRVTKKNYSQRLADAVRQFGEFLNIEPLPPSEHERIDPISELAEKVHPDKIIVVRV